MRLLGKNKISQLRCKILKLGFKEFECKPLEHQTKLMFLYAEISPTLVKRSVSMRVQDLVPKSDESKTVSEKVK